MNRAQRRKLLRNGFGGRALESEHTKLIPCLPRKDEHPDFSGVPLATVCQGIRLLINELRNRGYPVYDFDHKEKSIQSIQIIRDKVYFMAAEEAAEDGKAENGKQAHR